MLRDRAMRHYQARSRVFGSSHRLNNRRNGLGYRLTGMERGVGVTIGQRDVSSSADGLKVKEIEGDPLVNADALKSLIRLLRLAQVRVILFLRYPLLATKQINDFCSYLLTFLIEVS